MLRSRVSGSFAMHARMMRSSARGATGSSVATGGGSSRRIEVMRLTGVLPSKALRPVTISYRIAPNAKMSARASASAPSSCSGAMYWNVPTMAPSAVTAPDAAAAAIADP